MKPPAPVRMWAVVVRSSRAEWVHYHTIRRIRREAIAAYDEIWALPGEYARQHDKGRVRTARVIVSVEGEA